MAELLEPVAAVTLRALLVPLFLLCAYLVAAGIIHLVEAFVRAVFGTATGALGWIPYAGKLVTSSLHHIEARVTGSLGHAAADLDAKVGATFHSLAYVVTLAAEEIFYLSKALALAALKLAWHASPAAYVVRFLGLEHKLAHFVGTLSHPLRVLNRLVAQVGHLSPSFVRREIHTAVRGAEVAVEHDIASLRARTHRIEDSLAALYSRVKGLDALFGSIAFVGAVSIALGKLGMGWLRCPALGRIGSKVGCGGFGLLETFLSDAIEAFIVADLCDFVAVASDLAAEFEPLLIAFVDLEDALIGCRGATLPLVLDLPPLDLPATSAGLSLAA